MPAPASLSGNNRPKHLYVANSGSNDIFIANFDPSGAIFPINTNNIPTGTVPLSIQGHPSVNFMAVCNAQSGDIWSYTVDIGTGNLTRFGTPLQINASPVAMKWAPNGKFLYVLTNDPAKGPTLVTFDFDSTTQLLTLSNNQTTIGQATGGGINPQTGQPQGPTVSGTATALALAPGGTFAYVGITTPDTMAVVSLAPDGSTTQVGNVVNGGPTQTCIAPYPGGRFVWVTNGGSGDINLFTLNTTNSLQLNPSPIQAGQFPMDMLIDIAGTNAWVVNAQSGDINEYSIQGPSGTLTSLGSVGSDCAQTVGGQPWMPPAPPFPDAANAQAGVNPVAIVITLAKTFAYCLNLGVQTSMGPIPPTITIYSIGQGGVLAPIVMPTAAVPNGSNPVGCSFVPGSVFPQPDDITIY